MSKKSKDKAVDAPAYPVTDYPECSAKARELGKRFFYFSACGKVKRLFALADSKGEVYLRTEDIADIRKDLGLS